MFTGIIESIGKVAEIVENGTNKSFIINAELTPELKIDQSVSHNGVCLTIEKIWLEQKKYQVTAIDETLKKTNLGTLEIDESVNIERCMKADGRFDGHIVQGHVDQIGICESVIDKNGSYEIKINYDSEKGNVTVEKGSICINGISLTVFNSSENSFSVAIIPYTWEHTNLQNLKMGQTVNLEFDIVGKYIARMLKPYKTNIN